MKKYKSIFKEDDFGYYDKYVYDVDKNLLKKLPKIHDHRMYMSQDDYDKGKYVSIFLDDNKLYMTTQKDMDNKLYFDIIDQIDTFTNLNKLKYAVIDTPNMKNRKVQIGIS